jgi:hypothetical protein
MTALAVITHDSVFSGEGLCALRLRLVRRGARHNVGCANPPGREAVRTPSKLGLRMAVLCTTARYVKCRQAFTPQREPRDRRLDADWPLFVHFARQRLAMPLVQLFFTFTVLTSF